MKRVTKKKKVTLDDVINRVAWGTNPAGELIYRIHYKGYRLTEEYEILFEIMKDIASEYDQHDGYLPNEDSIKETGWYRLQHLIPPSEPIV